MSQANPKGQRKWRRQLPTEAFVTQQESCRLMIRWCAKYEWRTTYWFFGFWSFYFSYVQSRVDDTQRSILFSASFCNPSQSLAPNRTARHRKAFQIKGLPSSGAIVKFPGLSHPVRPGCSGQTSTALAHVVAQAIWSSLRLAQKKVKRALFASPPSVCHMFLVTLVSSPWERKILSVSPL